jgi:hypothetical protein
MMMGVRRGWLRAVTVGVLALAVLVAVVVAGGYGYARLRVDQVASVHVPGLTPAPPPGRPMNLLVVGSDTRQGLGRQDRGQFGTVAGQRGDVILLVHLVPATHRAWMLSVPRDLYVPVAGTGGRHRRPAASRIHLASDAPRPSNRPSTSWGCPRSLGRRPPGDGRDRHCLPVGGVAQRAQSEALLEGAEQGVVVIGGRVAAAGRDARADHDGGDVAAAGLSVEAAVAGALVEGDDQQDAAPMGR